MKNVNFDVSDLSEQGDEDIEEDVEDFESFSCESCGDLITSPFDDWNGMCKDCYDTPPSDFFEEELK